MACTVLMASVGFATAWQADQKTAPLSEDTKAQAFDLVWQQMDRRYSYFASKPDVDWAKLRDEYRPKALAAGDEAAFVEVLRAMLANLKDMHVWIQTPKGIIGTYANPWKRNFNERVVYNSLVDVVRLGNFGFVGKTKSDGFGCLFLLNQGAANETNVAQAIAAIDKLSDAPGFIVDLRSASGGNEALARKIAQRFCAADVVYATSKFRKGTPDHNEFGPIYKRILKAGQNSFTKPVVCLIGSKCMSSGEGFAKMMKALPHGTLMGESTRGASGNPKPIQLPGMKASVWHSTWIDMLPDGTTFEGKGIPPAIQVNIPYTAYAKDDPTFIQAVEFLRKKTGKQVAGID